MPSVCSPSCSEESVEQWRRAHDAGATPTPPARGCVGPRPWARGATQDTRQWYP